MQPCEDSKITYIGQTNLHCNPAAAEEPGCNVYARAFAALMWL